MALHFTAKWLRCCCCWWITLAYLPLPLPPYSIWPFAIWELQRGFAFYRVDCPSSSALTDECTLCCCCWCWCSVIDLRHVSLLSKSFSRYHTTTTTIARRRRGAPPSVFLYSFFCVYVVFAGPNIFGYFPSVCVISGAHTTQHSAHAAAMGHIEKKRKEKGERDGGPTASFDWATTTTTDARRCRCCCCCGLASWSLVFSTIFHDTYKTTIVFSS